MNNLEVGDSILCTVDRIVGTVVFVKIDDDGEGSIIMSEIAPGRIRNLREYVVPHKKIVCKVLRISPQGNIELSLRRVSQKEKKEVIEQDKQEKSYINILKSVLGAKTEETLREISKHNRIFFFLEEAKANPEKLENLLGKDNTKKILDILKSQKKKRIILKKEIGLTTAEANGITLIKRILDIFRGIKVRYISAGRYILEIESENIKLADKKMRDMMSIAEKESKKVGVEFSIK
jgi:translation initiation factor 2 alpha subunit (eIF-2alpha)